MAVPVNVIIIDFETTGLLKHPNAKLEVQPRIIEIGAALVNEKGKVLDSYSALANPGCSLEPIITKITGLTDADLEQEPPIQEQLAPLRRLFKRANIAIAHNMSFDKGVLELELERLEIKNWPWTGIEVCTVQEYTEEWGRRPKLSQLYEAFLGQPLHQTHRALDDVKALLEIVNHEKIISRYSSAARAL